MKSLIAVVLVSFLISACGIPPGSDSIVTDTESQEATAEACQPLNAWKVWGSCRYSPQWSQTLWEGHVTNDCNPSPSSTLMKLTAVEANGTANAACLPPAGSYPALCYISTLPNGSSSCTVSVAADGTVTLTSHSPTSYSSIYMGFRL